MSDFDPADHTVQEVLDYADEHPDEAEAILEAEQNGANRTTAVAGLEQLIANDQPKAGKKVVPGTPEAATQSPVSKSGELTSEEAASTWTDETGYEFDLTDGSDEYRMKLHKDGKI